MKHFLLLSLIFLPSLVSAQNTSVIPYSGTLFSEGKPVSQNNAVQMAFALYSDIENLDTGATDEVPHIGRLWTSWTSTDGADDTVDDTKTIGTFVRNGRFLVHLGDTGQNQTELTDSIFDTQPLYVVAWIVKNSGQNTVFRLSPQKLEKVPHAITAERANSFEVKGDLTVQGQLWANRGVRVSGGVLSIINDGLEGQGDNKTHFSYPSNGNKNNYIRGDNTVISSDVKFERRIILRQSLEHIRTSGTVSDTLSPRPFSAVCEGDRKIISGGCESPSDKAILYRNYPDAAGNHYLCYYRKRANADNDIQIIVHAFCL